VARLWGIVARGLGEDVSPRSDIDLLTEDRRKIPLCTDHARRLHCWASISPRFSEPPVLAASIHRNQVRKGPKPIPYVGHLLSVAGIAIRVHLRQPVARRASGHGSDGVLAVLDRLRYFIASRIRAAQFLRVGCRRLNPLAGLVPNPPWASWCPADAFLPSTPSCVQPLPCVPLRPSISDHGFCVPVLRCFFPLGNAPGSQLPPGVSLRVELLDDSGQIHYRWVPNERVPFACVIACCLSPSVDARRMGEGWSASRCASFKTNHSTRTHRTRVLGRRGTPREIH
jgi:hypothetical protein